MPLLSSGAEGISTRWARGDVVVEVDRVGRRDELRGSAAPWHGARAGPAGRGWTSASARSRSIASNAPAASARRRCAIRRSCRARRARPAGGRGRHDAGVASPVETGKPASFEAPNAAPGPTTAEQNPIEDRCPSPMPRRLIATRACPSPRPAWSGCRTALGLHSGGGLGRVLGREGRAEQELRAADRAGRVAQVRRDDRCVADQQLLVVVVTRGEVGRASRATDCSTSASSMAMTRSTICAGARVGSVRFLAGQEQAGDDPSRVRTQVRRARARMSGAVTQSVHRARVLGRREHRQRRLGALIQVASVGLPGRRSRRRWRGRTSGSSCRCRRGTIATRAGSPRGSRGRRVTRYALAQQSAIAATSIGCWSKRGPISSRTAPADGRDRQVAVAVSISSRKLEQRQPAREHGRPRQGRARDDQGLRRGCRCRS